jgi:hypothetical protein
MSTGSWRSWCAAYAVAIGLLALWSPTPIREGLGLAAGVAIPVALFCDALRVVTLLGIAGRVGIALTACLTYWCLYTLLELELQAGFNVATAAVGLILLIFLAERSRAVVQWATSDRSGDA